MTLALLLYRAALALARWIAPRASLTAARASSLEAFAAWAGARRDPARPLLLVHAASAGELRQAEPILRRLRQRHSQWQIAVTIFSPSGFAVARTLPVDVSGLLPWDEPGPIATLLDALKPSAIVVCKLDLWPVLALSARTRGIHLGLIAATVRARSGRLRWPARRFLSPAYAALDIISAVSDEDAARLARLGVDPRRIRIDGDPRFDAVIERLASESPPRRDTNLLVAGSTWPADERVLLSAFVAVRGAYPAARLAIAPHQPSPTTLTRLEREVRRLGLPAPRRCGDSSEAEALLVLDEVGPLAHLYGRGGMAFVGGGFGRAGLHSVLEPAAWGIPVIVGPRADDNADARRLEERGALARLPARDPTTALARRWLGWLQNAAAREAAGAAARATVLQGVGAAERATALVESLMGMQQGPAPGRPL
jgi:3-deoxy-D-manno-octulosonic-acid transferase